MQLRTNRKLPKNRNLSRKTEIRPFLLKEIMNFWCSHIQKSGIVLYAALFGMSYIIHNKFASKLTHPHICFFGAKMCLCCIIEFHINRSSFNQDWKLVSLLTLAWDPNKFANSLVMSRIGSFSPTQPWSTIFKKDKRTQF